MKRSLPLLVALLAAFVLTAPSFAVCEQVEFIAQQVSQVWTLADGECLAMDARGARVLTVETRPDSASQVLTGTGQPSDTETATIGATVYTGETGALDADYKFLIGASLTATLANLCSCINGDDDGVVCDAGTAAHPTVTCTGSTATTLTIEAIVPGSGANTIATTETLTTNAWGGATLVDVTDPVCTVSFVDSLSATTHTYFTEAVTDTTPDRSSINVSGPFALVTAVGVGGCVVAVNP